MVRNFRSMMDPLSTLPDEFRHAEPQVLPLWPDEAALQIRAYVSASKAERFTDDASYAVAMPWPAGGEGGGGAMRLSLGQAAQKVELSLRDADAAARPAARAAEAASEGLLGRFLPFGPPAAPPTPPAELVVPARGWQQLRRNGTLYLHVEVSTEALDLSGLPRDRDYDAARVLRAVVPLVKHGPAPYVRCCKRKLLGDLGWVPETTGIVRPPAEGEEVALWKPEVGVRVVVETRSFPAQMQLEGLNVVQPARNTFRYLPPLYADEIGLTSDKCVETSAGRCRAAACYARHHTTAPARPAYCTLLRLTNPLASLQVLGAQRHRRRAAFDDLLRADELCAVAAHQQARAVAVEPEGARLHRH